MVTVTYRQMYRPVTPEKQGRHLFVTPSWQRSSTVEHSPVTGEDARAALVVVAIIPGSSVGSSARLLSGWSWDRSPPWEPSGRVAE